MSIRGTLRVLAGDLVATSGTILGCMFGAVFERFNSQCIQEEGEVDNAFFAIGFSHGKLLERSISVEEALNIV